MAKITGFAVVGIEHLHIFELVQGLLDAGATELGHCSEPGPLVELYQAWQQDSPAREMADILADPHVQLVVLAGIPSERAGHAVEALNAGKSVLSDKPGVTTHAQLDAVVEAEAASERRWWVLFSERFTNRAMSAAVAAANAGEIGDVVDVVGLGPHTLNAEARPDWFWEPETSGGILGDIATHQIDQFCAVVDPGCHHPIEVTSSSSGNVACPHHPKMEDVGRLTLAGANAAGNHRVDYLTTAGLGHWGDCRLMITGTQGTLEVRANIDPGGRDGGEHLIRVDAEGTTRVDVSEVAIDWASRLLRDLQSGSDTFVSAPHVHRVCRLALTAQHNAAPWPGARP
jgi:predicted dehydrogenase